MALSEFTEFSFSTCFSSIPKWRAVSLLVWSLQYSINFSLNGALKLLFFTASAMIVPCLLMLSHVSSRIRSAIIDMKCGYYLRAATITFRLYYMWRLIEGGYYSMCGVYSRKCGGIFMLTSKRCSSTVHPADTNTY